MAAQYQTVYGVGLLDDLHNYFPRLLYSPQIFQTVPDVLGYIQQTTRSRFNLFENGMRQYSQTMPPVNTAHPIYATHTTQTPTDSVSAALLPLLRSLIVPRVVRVPFNADFNDPVIVHASQQLIESASTQETLEEDSENNCAICQDSMRQGELVRTITVCSHQFHISCIDNWLLNQSVLCPACRHDIREPQRVVSNRNTPVLTARAQAVDVQAPVQPVAVPVQPVAVPVQPVAVPVQPVPVQTPAINGVPYAESEDEILAAELLGSLNFYL